MPVALGVDIGTSSAKCQAVDEDGAILAFAQEPYPIARPHEGWAEQDPEDFERCMVAVVSRCVGALRAAGRSPRDVSAMALSTQADTMIVTDGSGRPLRPAMSWMDTRATVEHAEMLHECDRLFWYDLLGQPLTAYSSACKLRWLRRHEPHVLKPGFRVAFVPDFLAKRLTDRWVTDAPSASWSPFHSPFRSGPESEALRRFGVEASQLSAALCSGEPIGRISPVAAARMGLRPGALLVAGAFDQAAAAHGAGVAGDAGVLSCGTAWVLYSIASDPPADPSGRLCTCSHVRHGEWGLVLPFTGGSAYDWVERTVAQGGAPSETGAPIFIPHLYGGLSPDWHGESRGSLLGLTLEHTPEDIRLAMMRGLAFEARRNVEAAEAFAGRPAVLTMVGGAARSETWPQLIADAIGCEVRVAGVTEAACRGAAMLAAGDDARAWAVPAPLRTCMPRPDAQRESEDLYRRYLRAYEALLPVYSSVAPAPR